MKASTTPPMMPRAPSTPLIRTVMMNRRSVAVPPRQWAWSVLRAWADVVVIVEVVKEIHPDSTDTAWECVDLAARERLPKPVTLDQVKAEKRLAEMVLVRLSRLSVQPVTDAEWKLVCKMGGL